MKVSFKDKWVILPSKKGEVAKCQISGKIKFRGGNWYLNPENTELFLEEKDLIFIAKLSKNKML